MLSNASSLFRPTPLSSAHSFLSRRGKEKGKGKLSRSTEILDKVLKYQIN